MSERVPDLVRDVRRVGADLSPREAEDPPSGEDEQVLSGPVVLERLAMPVVGEPVALQGDPSLGVAEVEPESATADLDPVLTNRVGQAVPAQHLDQDRLELALRRGEARIQSAEYRPNPNRSGPAAPTQLEQPERQAVDVGQAVVQRAVDHPLEPSLGHARAEIDARSRRVGAEDALPPSQVTGVQVGQSVDGHAGTSARSAPPDGHLGAAWSLDQAVQQPGAEVGRSTSGPQGRGGEHLQLGLGTAGDPVDPGMDPRPSTPGESVIDLLCREAQGDRIHSGDDAVPSGGALVQVALDLVRCRWHGAIVAARVELVTGPGDPTPRPAVRSRCIHLPGGAFSAPGTTRHGAGHQLRRSTAQMSTTCLPSTTTIRSWYATVGST